MVCFRQFKTSFESKWFLPLLRPLVRYVWAGILSASKLESIVCLVSAICRSRPCGLDRLV